MCGLLKMWKRSPSTSTGKALCECAMFQRPVQRTWTWSHTKFLWFINFLTTTKKCDFSLQHGQKEKKFIFQTWFPYEAYFHGDGTVIKQNMHYWETETPANSHKRSSHRGNVTVWVAMSKQGLIGLMFFNETVNSEQYLHMFRNDFLPQLKANGLPLQAHVVYTRWCHNAWCKHRAWFLGQCVRPSHHVKLLSGPSQLQQLLATSQSWSKSWWLQFMVFLEGEAVPTKTI